MELQTTPLRYEQQVRAIIIFGDIRGFSIWEHTVTRPDDEFKPLMNQFDAMVDEHEAKTGWFTKNLGDGYMQVVELGGGHACGTATNVLRQTRDFCHRVKMMIEKSPWPRPDGFRVRVSAGHVWKKHGNKQDFVGRHVNMTHKLLRVDPETFFICHQSFLELMSKHQLKRAGYRATHVAPDRRTPDGILKADMNALWKLDRVRKT